MGYIMSISMCMQNFITIFHSVQEIGPFSLLQKLELGKASTNEKCHFTFSWARSLGNINIYAKKNYQNIPLSSRDRAIFTFSEFEPRQNLEQSQIVGSQCRQTMDGWVRVLRPFNSISVISRRWNDEHERLCAMKRRLGSGRISPPAGFEPATPWSEVGSANRSATRTLL